MTNPIIEIKCKYTELVHFSKLVPHPKNPHIHSPEQIDRLCDLIKFQGVRHPIIVSKKSGYLVVGHGRLQSMLKLGMKEIPVDYQDFENEAQEYAFIVSDNSIGKDEWASLDLSLINNEILNFEDFNVDMLGLKDFDITEPVIAQCEEDEVPEQVPTVSVLGDLYELGQHRLFCGDSTSIDAVENLMNGEKAVMVFTDPPYGISVVSKNGSLGGGTKGKYKQVIGDDTVDAAVDAYNLCVGLEIPTLVFWGGNHYSSNLPSSSCWLVWDKQAGKHVTFADCELAWTNMKKPVRMFTHIWDGFRRDSEKGEMRVHPTQKPVKLIQDIFEFFEDESKGSILDLFGGSGSTLIACEKTNRKCFMMELDPHYCDVIVSRWCKYTGNNKIKRNGEEIEWQV